MSRDVEIEDELDDGFIRDEKAPSRDAVIIKIVKQMMEYFTHTDSSSLSEVERGIISKEEFLQNRAGQYLTNGLHIYDEKRMNDILQVFSTYMWGYGPLEEYLYDESISDVKIVAYNNIRGKREGRRISLQSFFSSKEEADAYIQRVAALNQQNISDANALPVFTDIERNRDNRLRINIITKHVSSVGHHYLQIRKIPKIKRTEEEQIRRGLFKKGFLGYLKKRVDEGHGIIICGAGGSGKTHVFNSFLEKLDKNLAGFIIQESDELFSETHPELLFAHIISNSGEGKVNYTLRDLAKKGLLMDLDIFGIGEVKGPEALDLINAVYTGTVGICTVHAFNTREAIPKIVHYAKYATDYSAIDLTKMLCHLDTIVHVSHYHVDEVTEAVIDQETGYITYNTIYSDKRK